MTPLNGHNHGDDTRPLYPLPLEQRAAANPRAYTWGRVLAHVAICIVIGSTAATICLGLLVLALLRWG